jgi:hypothetical protein
VDVQSHIFLISALVGGEWSASRPGRFTPGEKDPSNHWLGRSQKRSGRRREEKILDNTGTQTPTSRSSNAQPVAITTTLSRLLTGDGIGLRQICTTKHDDKIKKLLLEITISHSTVTKYYHFCPHLQYRRLPRGFLSSSINICIPLPLISRDV